MKFKLHRALALLLALVLLLPGCGKKQDNTTSQDAETIIRVILGDLAEWSERDAFTWYLEQPDVDGYLTDFYKLDDVSCQDGAIVRMEGARAFEVAVLQLDEQDVDQTAEALLEYLLDRKGSFTGYFPDQVKLVDNALILTKGQWIALAVCENPEAAREDFEACFGDGPYAKGIIDFLPDEKPEDYRPDGRYVYTNPETDDMTLFDNSAILAAWESGDSSGLSREDKAVLDAAAKVLEEWTEPDMSDYDRELALYAWLTTHVRYDQSHYSRSGAPRSSYEPYGPLIKGTGVCLGYAETFRLLMDMVGIECITVTGAAFRNRENHAWNMVRLNGAWYCADPTWDHNDFDGSLQDYRELELDQFLTYFNVTSDFMADTDHQWDYDNTPEATAEFSPDAG